MRKSSPVSQYGWASPRAAPARAITRAHRPQPHPHSHRGRLDVSMLEGGYDLQALHACSIAHVGALLGRDG